VPYLVPGTINIQGIPTQTKSMLNISVVSFYDNFGLISKGLQNMGIKSTKSVRQNFFACRIVDIWNSLPDTVCFSSQAGFSQSLKDLSAYPWCY